VVLLNIENESYYSLDNVGSRMWQLLTEHQDMENVMSQLLQNFRIDESTLSQDLIELIEELIQEDLLARP
jgi:Coenzyme PQQ synthesis protein D (PqqD)